MNPHEATLHSWQAKLAENPAHPPAVMGVARALIALDRPEELIALSKSVEPSNQNLADVVLRMSSKQLPDRFELAEAYCQAAEDRGDMMEANTRWSLVRRRLSSREEAHLGYIHAMLRQRRGTEAEAAVSSALNFLGQRPNLREAQAEVAEARRRWTDAAGYWAAIARDIPDHPFAADRQRAAEHRAAQAPAATDIADIVVPKVRAEEHDEVRKLVMGFESIGHNCEFGLMQRQFGAEPLSLLRFSFTLVPTIKTLLFSKFDGIGDPAKMSVTDGGHEYVLHHAYSSWVMHTRIKPSPEIDLDKFLKDQARRCAFLRGKLVKDLENQAKIFVYWRADLTDADIDAIASLVEGYGPNMLMCVRLCDDEHPAGSIEWRGERLAVCALDRPGNAFRGARWNISVDYWIHFCRTVQARWAALRPVAEPAAA
jgi:hypothetical protein